MAAKINPASNSWAALALTAGCIGCGRGQQAASRRPSAPTTPSHQPASSAQAGTAYLSLWAARGVTPVGGWNQRLRARDANTTCGQKGMGRREGEGVRGSSGSWTSQGQLNQPGRAACQHCLQGRLRRGTCRYSVGAARRHQNPHRARLRSSAGAPLSACKPQRADRAAHRAGRQQPQGGWPRRSPSRASATPQGGAQELGGRRE